MSMAKPKVFLTNPIDRVGYEILKDADIVTASDPSQATLREQIGDADAIIVRANLPADIFEHGRRLRACVRHGSGLDMIPVDAATAQGIPVANVPAVNANAVAEYVVAAMLEMAQRRKFRLRDKTLGVIGVGHVGSRVVRNAQALGMRVLQNDPPRARAEKPNEFVAIGQVLSEADIISLHVPLTKAGVYSTYHLFAKDTLAALEDRLPILINTARGAVIDNKALLKAIDGGKVGGVVLDVWENEPNISPELLDVVDLATPHIAGYSFDGKVNGTRMIYEAACKFFQLQPRWTPNLPPPPVPHIELTVSSGEDDEEVLRRIVRRIYDITTDDAALRKNILTFDKLRAQAFAHTVKHKPRVEELATGRVLRAQLTALGFKMG